MGELTEGRRSRWARPWALAAIAAGLSMGAFTLGRSWASGVPENALVYSGTLDGPDVDAVTGEPIVVRFWTAGGSSEPLCEATDPAKVTWSGARFSVALPEACADAVHEEPNVEIEVLIGDERASLGRAPIGAVPYALEAARASEATGALASSIADLQARIAQLQQPGSSLGAIPVVKSNKATLQRIAPGEPGEILSFDTPVLLQLGEFDARVFTVQQRGIYQFSCNAYYRTTEETEGDGQGDWSGWLAVELRRDPAGAAAEQLIARDGFVSDAYNAYRRASTLVELFAGDTVSCAAVYEPEESETAEVSIGGAGNGITTFEGYLVTPTIPAAP